jgi:hypothetical protein
VNFSSRPQSLVLQNPDPLNLQPQVPVEGPGPIAVFERPELIGPLANVIRQLNYAVVLGADIDKTCLTSGSDRFTAAIVSDAVEAPLELCASILPNSPKILITSDASFSFRLAVARADVSAILTRPLVVNELSDWLEHFTTERSVTPASILIVDDDLLSAEFHAAVLRAAGMQTIIVTDPIEALNAMQTALPDLVLMDVQMPVTDGIELARIIRQSRQYLAVPIVFLSAERDTRVWTHNLIQ